MIKIEKYHSERIRPLLPLMHQWSVEAFKNPPYSYAGEFYSGEFVDQQIDPKDLWYVQDLEGIVVLAYWLSDEDKIPDLQSLIAIGAGIPFGSKEIKPYFDSKSPT